MMNTTAILYPMVALLWWSIAISMLMFYRRLKLTLKPSDYALGDPSDLPPYASLPNRNFINLFETPVLFYISSTVLFVIGSVNSLIVGLAWSYVGLRMIHTLIHVTYNNVTHRSAVFWFSMVVIIALVGVMTKALFAI